MSSFLVRTHVCQGPATLVLFLVLCASALGQRYLVHQYTEMDGLPSAQVYAVAQGPEGRMWFSTRLGIVAYDGAHWERFDPIPNNRPGLIGFDQEDELWVCSTRTPFYAGRLRDGVPQGFELPKGGVSCFAPVRRGLAFLGTSFSGAWILQGETWLRLPVGEADEESILCMAAAGEMLYIATRDGLFSMPLDLSRRAERVPALGTNTVLGTFADGERVWVAGDGWYGWLEDGEFFEAHRSDQLKFPSPSAVRIRPDEWGGAFLGHYNTTYYHRPGEPVVTLDRRSGLIDGGCYAIERDREGNVWVCGMRGVSKLVNRGITSYDTSYGLHGDEVSAIHRLGEDGLVLGHAGGASIFTPTHVQAIDFGAPRAFGRVMDIDQDDQGHVWLCTTDLGIGKLDDSGEIEWHPGPEGDHLAAIVAASEGMWVAGGHGLWWREEGTYRRPVDHPLITHPMRRLFLDDQERLWIAASDDGLMRLDPDGALHNWRGDSHETNNVFTVFVTAAGRVLAGSEVGILEPVDGRLVPAADMQMDVPAYMINEDPERGILWVGTSRGVARFADGQVRWVTTADGLIGSEVNRAGGWVDPSGQVWIGTDQGVSTFQPEVLGQVGAPPALTLLSAEHAGRELPLDEDACVASGPGPQVWSFRAIAFVDEERTRFRYRLEGMHDEWVGPLELPTRQITYSFLTPGRYRLELQAIGANGITSEVLRSPWVEIPTPLLGRLWFQSLLGALAAGVIWMVVSTVGQRRYARRLEGEVQSRTTQLLASEGALAEDRERLAATLASIADGVAATDREGRVFLWNEAAEAITGHPSEAVLGRSLDEVLGLSATSLDRVAFQFEAQDARGQRRTYEASVARLDSRGRGSVIAFRDIADRLELERELAGRQRLESLGLLAGGIAHDFNNYLTVIMGTLGMLLDEQLGEDTRDQVKLAEGSLERAVSLTQQLLTFSKGGAPLRTSVSLEHLLRDGLTFALSGSAVQGRLELAPDLRPAYADAGQLAQVINNLLLNARQAMPGGGRVVVSARNVDDPAEDLHGPWIQIAVEDDGPGIDPEALGLIFDPFVTLKDGGTGLGLAIAHSIVTRHGGRISVSSELGRGARFELLLPASSHQDPPQHAPSPPWRPSWQACGTAPCSTGRRGPDCARSGTNSTTTRGARHLEEGLGVVQVLDHRLALGPGRGHAGPAHDEGHGQGLLVHPALVEPAVVAEVEALIGGVDDDRVVVEAVLLEVGQQAPDALVDAADAAQVVLEVALVLPAHQVVPLEPGLQHGRVLVGEGGVPGLALGRRHLLEVAEARAVVREAGLGVPALERRLERVVDDVHVPIDLHLLEARGGGVVQVAIEEGRGLGQVLVLPQFEVTQGRHPGAVRRLVLAHQQERLVAVRVLVEPVDREVGDDVGAVALDLAAALGVDQHGVVVVALPGQHVPVIEALGIGAQVPLADHRGLVADRLQQLGEGLLVAVELVPVVHEPVLVAVLAGQDDRAARTTDRVGAEAAPEEHALGGESIEVGRGLDRLEPTAVRADRVGRVVVGEQEQDVGAVLAGGEAARRGQEEETEGAHVEILRSERRRDVGTGAHGAAPRAGR